MTAYHRTTAPLPPGVVHLTNLVPEADAHAILAALDISDVRATTEGVRVPLPNGPPPLALAAARAAFKKAADVDAALYGELMDAPLLAQPTIRPLPMALASWYAQRVGGKAMQMMAQLSTCAGCSLRSRRAATPSRRPRCPRRPSTRGRRSRGLSTAS